MEMPSNSWSDGSFARYGHPVFVPIGDSVDPSVETVISLHTPSRSIDLPETHWPSILSQNGRFHEENVLKITIWRAVCPLWLPQMFLGESETRALNGGAEKISTSFIWKWHSWTSHLTTMALVFFHIMIISYHRYHIMSFVHMSYDHMWSDDIIPYICHIMSTGSILCRKPSCMCSNACRLWLWLNLFKISSKFKLF